MEILQWKNIVAPGEEFHILSAKRTADNPLRPHGHDFAEMFWLDMGQGTHVINGESHPLEIGDLIFIRPGDVHAIKPAETLQLTNLAFAADVLKEFETRYFGKSDFAWWTKNSQPASEKLSADTLARFSRWAEELTHAPRNVFSLHRFLLNLLHRLQPHEYSHLDLHQAPPWLQRACREMEKSENLITGLEAFFRLAERSREHTARSLKECCGLSPTEFLQKLRLQKAARLLETGDREILGVAFDCGFENISHFYRLFKQHFGETPKAYRIRRRQLL